MKGHRADIAVGSLIQRSEFNISMKRRKLPMRLLFGWNGIITRPARSYVVGMVAGFLFARAAQLLNEQPSDLTLFGVVAIVGTASYFCPSDFDFTRYFRPRGEVVPDGAAHGPTEFRTQNV
jgi:hypothetical protein